MFVSLSFIKSICTALTKTSGKHDSPSVSYPPVLMHFTTFLLVQCSVLKHSSRFPHLVLQSSFFYYSSPDNNKHLHFFRLFFFTLFFRRKRKRKKKRKHVSLSCLLNPFFSVCLSSFHIKIFIPIFLSLYCLSFLLFISSLFTSFLSVADFQSGC